MHKRYLENNPPAQDLQFAKLCKLKWFAPYMQDRICYLSQSADKSEREKHVSAGLSKLISSH